MEPGVPNLTEREHDEIRRAEAAGRPVVVFVHGLWMLPSSWAAWRHRFEVQGYATIAPDWPADPDSVEAARADPQAMALNSIASVTAHHAAVIRALSSKPAVVGHSYGGLIAQLVAGMGLAGATVAISPAPVRGVLRPRRPSTLMSTMPILADPRNRRRAVMLSYPQFRHAFANAVGANEANDLYNCYVVPGAGRLVFETASANLNPRSPARVDFKSPERGPLKIMSGEADRMFPWAIAKAAFRRQLRNPAPTEFFELLGRGHSMCIDSGWEDVADTTLRFVHRSLAAK